MEGDVGPLAEQEKDDNWDAREQRGEEDEGNGMPPRRPVMRDIRTDVLVKWLAISPVAILARFFACLDAALSAECIAIKCPCRSILYWDTGGFGFANKEIPGDPRVGRICGLASRSGRSKRCTDQLRSGFRRHWTKEFQDRCLH